MIMMMMMMMTMVMMMMMMMVMTNKLSAVYLIYYSAGSKIPRVLPLLSYYTFGREGELIKNIIFFTKH